MAPSKKAAKKQGNFRFRGRHHNRNGLRQIKNGHTYRETLRIAKRLAIPTAPNIEH